MRHCPSPFVRVRISKSPSREHGRFGYSLFDAAVRGLRRLLPTGVVGSPSRTISKSPSASTSTRSSYFDRFGGTYGGIGDGSGGAVGIGEAFARFRIRRPFAPLGRRHQARRKGAPHEWTPYKPSTNSSPWRSGAISREPRCFFVVALCLGRFPSGQRAVRNRYRMGRCSNSSSRSVRKGFPRIGA